MAAFRFKFLPTTPVVGTMYLTEDDRNEVLHNKWRDFAVRPVLPEDGHRDMPTGMAQHAK